MCDLRWLEQPIKQPDAAIRAQAQQRQTQLTKPLNALGQLEDIAIQLAAMQCTPTPHIHAIHIAIFAADHGVCVENVSAYPQSVTVEMLHNFIHGGAAINVLARCLNADLSITDVGTVTDIKDKQVRSARVAAGTANFSVTAAMTESQCAQALNVGRDTVLSLAKTDLFIGGEMGIGNTTAAGALACALLDTKAHHLTGVGTGLNAAGIAHKTAVIERALQLHHTANHAPFNALQCVGGFEIAALVGAMIACAQRGIPVLVDGFIVSVAALTAVRMYPAVRDWLLFSHQSAEQGHRIVLTALDAKPLVNLSMCLGEGSGAAVVVPLLQHACALHNEMATFTEAAVSKSHVETNE